MRNSQWRELPYGLVGGGCLLLGLWLSRGYPDSSAYLWVSLLGLAVLLWRFVVRTYTGVRRWRRSEPYKTRRRHRD
jgi:hypothetical protein